MNNLEKKQKKSRLNWKEGMKITKQNKSLLKVVKQLADK